MAGGAGDRARHNLRGALLSGPRSVAAHHAVCVHVILAGRLRPWSRRVPGVVPAPMPCHSLMFTASASVLMYLACVISCTRSFGAGATSGTGECGCRPIWSVERLDCDTVFERVCECGCGRAEPDPGGRGLPSPDRAVLLCFLSTSFAMPQQLKRCSSVPCHLPQHKRNSDLQCCGPGSCSPLRQYEDDLRLPACEVNNNQVLVFREINEWSIIFVFWHGFRGEHIVSSLWRPCTDVHVDCGFGNISKRGCGAGVFVCVQFLCSDAQPCENIHLADIHVQPSERRTELERLV